MSRARVLGLLLAALLSTVLAVSWAPAAWGGDASKPGDNAAEAFNEKDGKSVFELAFDVRRVSNGVVDQTNSAVAYANCENCQTVAIAVQIILVAGSPDVVSPQNIAVAVNEDCISCQTLALAYQFVLGGGEPLEFTHEGRKQLKRIQREFKKLGKKKLTDDEIRTRAGELADGIRDVLANQVVPRSAGSKDDEGDGPPPDGDPPGSENRDETEAGPQDGQAPPQSTEPEAPAQEQPPQTTEQQRPPPPTTTTPAAPEGSQPPKTP